MSRDYAVVAVDGGRRHVAWWLEPKWWCGVGDPRWVTLCGSARKGKLSVLEEATTDCRRCVKALDFEYSSARGDLARAQRALALAEETLASLDATVGIEAELIAAIPHREAHRSSEGM